MLVSEDTGSTTVEGVALIEVPVSVDVRAVVSTLVGACEKDVDAIDADVLMVRLNEEVSVGAFGGDGSGGFVDSGPVGAGFEGVHG